MKFRNLRIAWSVGWGLLAVLLCMLWVRSHSIYDAIGWHSKTSMYYSLSSQYGHITFVKGYSPIITTAGVNYSIGHKALEPFVGSPSEPELSSLLGLRWYCSHGVRAFREFILALPHWLVLLFTIVVAAAPWLRWRFRLRTLFIATTLVAVMLGLIVYAVRR
jgi:hypothetical protein